MEEIVGDTPEEVTEAKTMDDTIRETYEAIQARGSEPEETPETPETQEAPETPEQKAERLRDEKGRFAKTEVEAESEPVENTAEPTPTVPPELQRLGLRKEEADEIAKNPVAMQAIIRRSEEMHKGLEQYRNKAQFGDAIEKAISPYMQTIHGLGLTPDVAINKLMSVDHNLRYGNQDQKIQTLAQVARDYGVDIGQVQQFSANQPQVDPQVQQLQGQLQQMQSWIQQQNQAREWEERQSLNSTIENFSKDPANIHFEAVRNDMAGLLQAGLASDLKDAYEKAIYANPTIRAQILAEQQAKAEAERKAEVTQKAQAAKKAASANVPRKGVLPAAKPIGTMDDTIREAAMRLGII